MTQQLQRNGFLLVPVLSVYDTETKITKTIQKDPIPIQDGEGLLTEFEKNFPVLFAQYEVEFKKHIEMMDTLAAATPKPNRTTRRAPSAKKTLAVKKAPSKRKR